MATSELTSDCWPTADHVRLIRAALADGPMAGRALEDWRARVDVRALDRPSQRLLPLLHGRLHEHAADDPLAVRIEESFERARDRNRVLMATAAEAVGILRAEGIDSVLLKGMAMIARGYMTEGGRPMADCDLLVPTAQALAARDALVRRGWRLVGRLDRDLLPLRHATAMTSPTGQSLDLHWHVLPECCEPGADDDFWSAAVPATLGGTATATLCPTDMFLHACVHGLSWSIAAPVRWVTDTLLMLRSGDEIDWHRLAGQAERRILVLPILDALRYLRDVFDAPVPAWIEPRLASAPLPRWADGEHRVKMRRRTRQRQILFHWFLHRRLRGSGTLLGDLLTAPAYARRRWHLP